MVFGQRNAVAAEVLGDGLPELKETLGRPIGQDFVVEGVKGVDDRPGCRDIGVADIQEINLQAPLDRVVGVGFELPDRGCLNGPSAIRNIHGKVLLARRFCV